MEVQICSVYPMKNSWWLGIKSQLADWNVLKSSSSFGTHPYLCKKLDYHHLKALKEWVILNLQHILSFSNTTGLSKVPHNIFSWGWLSQLNNHMKPKKFQSMNYSWLRWKSWWLAILKMTKKNKKKTVCDFGDLSKIKVNPISFFITNHWLIIKKTWSPIYIVTVNV